ncbi:MAG: hypothetical protein JKY95_05595 [Planctomycetaceae bacterium]|nr:hypothetical protein [Planctomycetaceae bacterium]
MISQCGFRFLFALLLATLVLPGFANAESLKPQGSPRALQNYVDAKDDSYEWKLLGQHELPQNLGKVYNVQLTSQTWQGMKWTHLLAVFEPARLTHPKHCLLFITGGRTGSKVRDGDLLVGAKLANMTGTRCAFLLQVPNQPLMGDKFEDDLISETFLKYLESGDETWPLLFPMTKSAVKAMDAIQELSQDLWKNQIEKFVVTGASKRGWTTWLTGVVDDRVAGIAPIVIDTLNLQPQMKHQIDIWGKYSVQIEDYTSKGLIEVMQNQPDGPLWKWVDPYTYRKELKLPKLLINGTNDPYWVLDALNIYWDGLVGQKHLLYVPNAGHGLGDGKEFALMTLAAFVKHIASDTPMPQMQWKHTQPNGQLQLSVSATPKPTAVKLWSAKSDSGDFREVKWTSSPMARNGKGHQGAIPKPAQGHAAIYAEVQFVIQGLKYSLATQIHRE